MYQRVHRHHRKSIRLKGYDYSQAGFYFVTICINNRQCLLGNVVEGKMVLNQFGNIVQSEWLNTKVIRKNIKLDNYIIMPDHMHGIIIIDYPINGGAHGNVPPHIPTLEKFGKSTPNSIPTIIKLFKACVTNKINQVRNTPRSKIWQRGYYEHIIRSEYELNHIRQYIINNPLKWELDRDKRENQTQ